MAAGSIDPAVCRAHHSVGGVKTWQAGELLRLQRKIIATALGKNPTAGRSFSERRHNHYRFIRPLCTTWCPAVGRSVRLEPDRSAVRLPSTPLRPGEAEHGLKRCASAARLQAASCRICGGARKGDE